MCFAGACFTDQEDGDGVSGGDFESFEHLPQFGCASAELIGDLTAFEAGGTVSFRRGLGFGLCQRQLFEEIAWCCDGGRDLSWREAGIQSGFWSCGDGGGECWSSGKLQGCRRWQCNDGCGDRGLWQCGGCWNGAGHEDAVGKFGVVFFVAVDFHDFDATGEFKGNG